MTRPPFFISDDMGKNCLNKLSGNITVRCTVPQVGVKNIYLMHTEDVDLTPGASGLSVTGATFVQDRAPILVEGYKQNIQITGAVRTTEASAKMDFSVVFKIPRDGLDQCTPALLHGKFYVLAVFMDGTSEIIGYTSPLECSGVDWDSNANAGLITVTLAAPEGSAGNYLMEPSDFIRDLIISKAV